MQENDIPENALKKTRAANVSNSLYHKVDIIIPSRGEFGRCIDLVSSIFKLVKNVDYNIILIIDGKEASNLQSIFKKTPRIKVISTGKEVGFGAAVNLGVKNSSSELCCVMHNDIQIHDPNFLHNLAKDLLSLKSKKVVSISSVTNNPMNKKLDFMIASKAEDVAPVIIQQNCLPFICNMFYKKAYLYVGGLPEYQYCWFECDLFADKLQKNEMKQAVCRRSYVQHEGGITILKLLNKNPSVKATLKENLKLYQAEKKKIFGTN